MHFSVFGSTFGNKSFGENQKHGKEILQMRRSIYLKAFIAAMLLALLVWGTGCGPKKPAVPEPTAKEEPTPIPSPAPPAAMISLNASPSAIEKGQSTTLTWKSSNASGVTIDNGIGTVEPSGSRTVSPSVSTTYKATATSPGGNAVAEARVTVTAPEAVTPPPLPAISDSEFFSSSIKDAFFDYDSYDIREDARAALLADVQALKQRPSIRITIEGHCDERGSERYNLALGDRRANAAREFMVSQGIAASRIDTVSYGEERNFCEEHNEECWQLNRRARIVMR
jgi:peptidoglycan-associated lipoprotein